MRVVLDTNVLVSAQITPGGNPAQIIYLTLTVQILPLFDERMLREYRIVLQREEFSFEPFQVDELLSQLVNLGEFVVADPHPVSIPDPTDLPFLEVALSGRADALITGNKKDFGRPPKGLKILSPAEFLAFLRTLPTI